LIDRVIVSKKDVHGNWVELLNQKPGQAWEHRLLPSLFTVDVPADPTTRVVLELPGYPNATAVDFGDRILFRLPPIPAGNVSYQVRHITQDGVSNLVSYGNINTNSPVLQGISGVTMSGGVLTWPAPADPTVVQDLAYRQIYYLPDNYTNYRLLEEATALFFSDTASFPSGFSWPNWMGGTLYKLPNDTAMFVKGATAFTFTKNDSVIDIASRNPDIRQGWEAQMAAMGKPVHFALDPDAYVPGAEQNQYLRQLNYEFDYYFEHNDAPIGQAFARFGGLITKLSSEVARLDIAGEQSYYLTKSGGTFKAMKENSHIREAWDDEYGARDGSLHIIKNSFKLTRAEWQHNAQTGATSFNLSSKPTGAYQYELLFKHGATPYAHAIGAIDVSGRLINTGLYPLAWRNNSPSGYAQLQSDLNAYFSNTGLHPMGFAEGYLLQTFPNGKLIRGTGSQAYFAKDGITTTFGSDVNATVATNPIVRDIWGQQFQIGWTNAPGWYVVNPEVLSSIDYYTNAWFGSVPVGTTINWLAEPSIWKQRIWRTTPTAGGTSRSSSGTNPSGTGSSSRRTSAINGRATISSMCGICNGSRATTRATGTCLWEPSCISPPIRNMRRAPFTRAGKRLPLQGNDGLAHYVAGPLEIINYSDLTSAAAIESVRRGWHKKYEQYGLQFYYGPENYASPVTGGANIALNPTVFSDYRAISLGADAFMPTITSEWRSSYDTSSVVKKTLDRWGNVTQVSDARNEQWVTNYTYNSANQMISEEHRNGGLYAASYDEHGNQYLHEHGNAGRQRVFYDSWAT
jgi:YD repeat-containing protein